MLELEEFFLHTINDLRNRIVLGSTYDLIRACALCRQLLFDGPGSLGLRVAAKYHKKLQFEIADFPFALGNKGFQIFWSTIVPGESPVKGATRVKLTLQQFEQRKILQFHEQLFSVHELIIAHANYMGGVHMLIPTKTVNALIALNGVVQNDPLQTALVVKAVCKVILQATEELENEILLGTPQPAN